MPYNCRSVKVKDLSPQNKVQEWVQTLPSTSAPGKSCRKHDVFIAIRNFMKDESFLLNSFGRTIYVLKIRMQMKA